MPLTRSPLVWGLRTSVAFLRQLYQMRLRRALGEATPCQVSQMDPGRMRSWTGQGVGFIEALRPRLFLLPWPPFQFQVP